MPATTLDQQHPAVEIRGILQELDRELHEVINYTDAKDFDPLTAAELMGHFGQAYQTLGYHRFTGLLLSMDELQHASPDESEEASPGTHPEGIPNHQNGNDVHIHADDLHGSESTG